VHLEVVVRALFPLRGAPPGAAAPRPSGNATASFTTSVPQSMKHMLQAHIQPVTLGSRRIRPAAGCPLVFLLLGVGLVRSHVHVLRIVLRIICAWTAAQAQSSICFLKSVICCRLACAISQGHRAYRLVRGGCKLLSMWTAHGLATLRGKGLVILRLVAMTLQ